MVWKLLELLGSSAWFAGPGDGGHRQQRPKSDAPIAPLGPRILVVEGHSLVGAAVGGLLVGPPLNASVETVLDTEMAIARLGAADFDLVVCELSDPPSKAHELVAGLAALGGELPVVFLAEAEQKQLLLDSMASGAKGFFTTDCGPDEFITGLGSVLQGRYTVGSRLERRVSPAARTSSGPADARRRSDDSRK